MEWWSSLAFQTSLLPFHSQNTDEETRENRLKPQRRQCRSGDHPSHGLGIIQMSKARLAPEQDGRQQHAGANGQRAQSQNDPALQVDQLEESLERLVAGQQSFVNRKGLR